MTSLIEKLRVVLQKNYIGLVVILSFFLFFFSPLLVNVSTYMEMGDKMFNAWTLARNHACLMGQNCINYVDGNIFFPNKNSMLYSETQLSAGILTFPLVLFTDNPITITNIWTLLSYLFSGWFMYLLGKRLSGGNEIFSVLAGLIFMFAPIRLGSGAVTHLQNLSIFYLPLIFLAAIKYKDTKQKRYLTIFTLSLALLFYASWYQMVFVAIAVIILLIFGILTKYFTRFDFLMLTAGFILATLSTTPLAIKYLAFSKSTGATFSLSDQVQFSSSLTDYLTPYYDTALGAILNNLGYNLKYSNPDSTSYMGITLPLLAIVLLAFAVKRMVRSKIHRQSEDNKFIILASILVLSGFLLSLGPLIKLGANFAYFVEVGNSLERFVIPGPWLLVTQFLPQLNFIRAIGRIAILVLFAFCILVALTPNVLNYKKRGRRLRVSGVFFLTLCLAIELMPFSTYRLSPEPFSYHSSVPKIYSFLKKSPDINNLVILRSTPSYTSHDGGVAEIKFEDVLWAGYHNKNIFNGLSGYTPSNYSSQYEDFVDFHEDDLEKLHKLGINYIIIDNKMTSSASQLAIGARQFLSSPIYSDDRYGLYKI